jgi:hypothetical protein
MVRLADCYMARLECMVGCCTVSLDCTADCYMARLGCTEAEVGCCIGVVASYMVEVVLRLMLGTI